MARDAQILNFRFEFLSALFKSCHFAFIIEHNRKSIKTIIFTIATRSLQYFPICQRINLISFASLAIRVFPRPRGFEILMPSERCLKLEINEMLCMLSSSNRCRFAYIWNMNSNFKHLFRVLMFVLRLWRFFPSLGDSHSVASTRSFY